MIGGAGNEIRQQSSQSSHSRLSNSAQNTVITPGTRNSTQTGANSTNSSQASRPNQGAPEARVERIAEFYKFLKHLRWFVLNSVNQVREELLGLLYFLVLYMYQESFATRNARYIAELKQISPAFREDLSQNIGFVSELHLLDTVYAPEEDLTRVVPDLKSSKILYVSQYTYEVLAVFLRDKRFTELYANLARELKIEIKEVKDRVKETYKSTNTVISQLRNEDFDKVNKTTTNFKALRDDLVFLSKLDAFVKLKPEQQTNSKKLNDKLNAISDVKDRSYLEKSSIVLPEVNINFQLNFMKHYIEREKLSTDEVLKEPHVLGVSISDPQEVVTAIEFDKCFNIMLLGFESSHIECRIMNPKFPMLEVLDKAKKRSAETLRKTISNESLFADILEQSTTTKGGYGRANGLDSKKKSADSMNCIKFIGHEGAITSLSINYDELYFLSSSVDTTIRLWCIRQRACLQIYNGHLNTIWTVKFSPKGFYFASGSSDSTARLWTTDKTVYTRIFVGHTSDVNKVEFIENCNYLVTSSHDKIIRVWELVAGTCIRALSHNNTVVTALATTLNGTYLASGSADGLVIVWDLVTGEKKLRLNAGKGKQINGLSFTIDEVMLACSTKRRLSYYDIGVPQHNDLYKDLMTDKTAKELGIKDEVEPLNHFESSDQDFLTIKFHPRNFLTAVTRCIGT